MNYMPSSAGSFSPEYLIKSARSVLFESSAASLECQFETLTGRAKAPPKSQQCDASPNRLEGLRGVQPRLEGLIHRPGADTGACFGLEILRDEFPQICRARRHTAAVASHSRGETWSLLRSCALPPAERQTTLSGQRAGVAGKAAKPARQVEIVRPDVKAPREAGRLRGAEKGSIRTIDASDYRQPASARQTCWGRQACTCRGAGACLCCRRFDRAICAHLARVATAGGC